MHRTLCIQIIGSRKFACFRMFVNFPNFRYATEDKLECHSSLEGIFITNTHEHSHSHSHTAHNPFTHSSLQISCLTSTDHHWHIRIDYFATFFSRIFDNFSVLCIRFQFVYVCKRDDKIIQLNGMLIAHRKKLLYPGSWFFFFSLRIIRGFFDDS